jgi:hypothetical protein
MRQIMALPETGEVMTLCGWKPYHSPRLTRRDAPLVRVTFDDGFTVSCTPEHRFLTESGWRFAADLTMGMLIRSCSMDSPNTSMGDFIDSTGVTTPEEENCFTEQRGSLLSAPFPGGITSIIEMVIRITTTFRISNAFRPMSISARASARGLQPARFASGSWLVAALPNGIVLKPGDFGIDDMPRGQRAGPSGSESLAPAFGVNESLRRSFERMAGCRSSARTPARPRTIANVKLLHDVADVWCLTVPEIGHFCLENGAIVHNSNGADAFRYMSLVVKTELKIDTTASERFAASPQVTGWTLDELFEDYDKHRVRLNEGRI